MKLRRTFNKFHLWVGLMSALIFVFIGLTGSVIVFEEPLDRLLSPSFFAMKAPAEGPQIPLSEIVRLVEGERTGIEAVRIDFRHTPTGPYVVHAVEKSADGALRQREFSVDPYAGVVIAERSALHFVGLVWRLHVDLMMGEFGRTVLGIAAIALLVSAVTGIVLWWPRRGRLRQAVTVKRGASAHRLQIDLHRVTGAYLAVPIVVASLTGVMIIWPEQTFPVVETMLEIPERNWPEPRPLDATRHIGPDAVPGIVRSVMSRGAIRTLHLPTADDPFYSVAVRSFSNGHPRGRSFISIYRDDGEIHSWTETRGAPFGYQLRWEWLVPIHSGDVIGLLGTIPMMLAGLSPLVFTVTGVLIWRRRSAARRLSAERRTPGS